MFRRSLSGLSNQSLFHRKRFIVYVEEEPGLDPGRSVDISFWRSFFAQNYSPNLFEYKPLGGKRHVLEMANVIIANSVPNCLCALDRDYDGLFGETLSDDRVFYTYGYGVENDLFGEPVITQIVRALIPGHQNYDKVALEILGSIEETVSLGRVPLLSDQIASSRSCSTLDRSKPVAALDLNNHPIGFRRKEVLDRLRECKGTPKTRHAVEPLRARGDLVPCHLYFEIVFHTIIKTISKITNVKTSKDQMRSIALTFLMVSFEIALSALPFGHYSTLGKRDLSKFSTLSATA